MEQRRTVLVKLAVDSDDAALLRSTVDEFLWAAQYVTDHAFQGEYVTTSKTTLHHEAYEVVRAETNLHSDHVQAARNKATDACKSVVKRWTQTKKASKPRFTTLLPSRWRRRRPLRCHLRTHRREPATLPA